MWVSQYDSTKKHTSPLLGPWSNHRETTHWRVALTVDNNAQTFALHHHFNRSHKASNRGSSETFDLRFSGHITPGSSDEGRKTTSMLLHITHREACERSYREPMEDMFTPPIREDDSLPPSSLPHDQRMVLRAEKKGQRLTLTLDSSGERSSTGWVGESYLVDALTAAPLKYKRA